MSTAKATSRIVGLLIGVGLLGGGIYAVAFVEWRPRAPEEPPPVRPLKTVVIGSPLAPSGRKYPGKVRPNQEVKLAFQVSGALIEFPVKKGQQVQEGELLARLDPRDFQSNLTAKQGILANAKFTLEKTERLRQSDAASPDELINAKASLDVAQSDADTAAKALEDTYLRAPFAGIVADTLVQNYENVQAKQPVLSLQDIKDVEIEVSVPEERVIHGRGDRDRYRFSATFDYLPGREFEVQLTEFATDADPLTQTYLATFVMPAPEDVIILPGMTTTIHEYRKEGNGAEEGGYAVPIDAVPIDGLGTYFVWIVQPDQDGTFTVHRRDVQVGQMVENDILVVAGLENGDRIAAVGVHVLQEGQRVRLLESSAEDGAE